MDTTYCLSGEYSPTVVSASKWYCKVTAKSGCLSRWRWGSSFDAIFIPLMMCYAIAIHVRSFRIGHCTLLCPNDKFPEVFNVRIVTDWLWKQLHSSVVCCECVVSLHLHFELHDVVDCAKYLRSLFLRRVRSSVLSAGLFVDTNYCQTRIVGHEPLRFSSAAGLWRHFRISKRYWWSGGSIKLKLSNFRLVATILKQWNSPLSYIRYSLVFRCIATYDWESLNKHVFEWLLLH